MHIGTTKGQSYTTGYIISLPLDPELHTPGTVFVPSSHVQAGRTKMALQSTFTKEPFLARNKAVNDYSIVIQEFFIKRVEDYLNTVGKELFEIEHYWC